MIITTAIKPDSAMIEKAEALARELNAPYVPRRQYTLKTLLKKYEAQGVLVIGREGLRYTAENHPPLFYHPGMALVRIRSLLNGGTDPMLEVSGASYGDRVLDCTAGLGWDALVFSFAVGEAGSVTAVETSPLVSVIAREGLKSAATGLPEADEACRRIRVVQGNHEDILRRMPDKSVDIVYFDPMFEKAVMASSAMLPLRYHACHDPVSEEAVRHAVRVARKAVVMKNSPGNESFSRLGFMPAHTGPTVSYGVIHVANAAKR